MLHTHNTYYIILILNWFPWFMQRRAWKSSKTREITQFYSILLIIIMIIINDDYNYLLFIVSLFSRNMTSTYFPLILLQRNTNTIWLLVFIGRSLWMREIFDIIIIKRNLLHRDRVRGRWTIRRMNKQEQQEPRETRKRSEHFINTYYSTNNNTR